MLYLAQVNDGVLIVSQYPHKTDTLSRHSLRAEITLFCSGCDDEAKFVIAAEAALTIEEGTSYNCACNYTVNSAALTIHCYRVYRYMYHSICCIYSAYANIPRRLLLYKYKDTTL